MIELMTLSFLKFAALYFIIINSIYGLLLIVSWFKIRQFRKMENKNDLSNLPNVSFLVPAYNEESLIVEAIQTYLSIPQKNKEIIIVNDGSHDQTMSLLVTMFQLKKIDHPSGIVFQSLSWPELKVVEAPHQGKAQALNFGLKFTQYDLICTMDADTIPTVHGVETCLKAFRNDPKLIATGGVIQVLSSQELKSNSPLITRTREWLTSFQRIEYLRTFVCERLGWSFLGSTLLISGAFCMIKKSAILKIGGFNSKSITEDFELIVRLRKHFKGVNYNFKILPVTTCYTQVPRTLSHLSRQRIRWQMGLVQTLFEHGQLILNPKHGVLGGIAVPYFWLVEVFSPVIVFFSYLMIPLALFFSWINLFPVALFLGIGVIFNLIITTFGIYFDDRFITKEKKWSIVTSLVETTLLHLGYKQLNSWWRLKALIKLLKTSGTWGEKPRVELIHHF